MKSIKQIRENYDLITEKEETEDRKLATLVRAGLYDAKKLPALKKALDKSVDKMTAQEKRMLITLLDSLINQVISNDQVYRKVRQNVQHMNEAKEDYLSRFDPRFKKGYPSEKDIPTVLILKRKAIRVYPDNQKVALYYSQALDKYVTIPFSDVQVGINEAKSKTSDEEKEKRKSYAAINARLKSVPYKRVSKMLRTGKVLPSDDKLGKKVSKLTGKFSDISSRVGKAGAAGVMIHNLIKNTVKGVYRKKSVKRALQKRLERKKSLSNQNKPASNQNKPAVSKTSVPEELKRRSPEETKRRIMANPNVEPSEAALRHAGIIKEKYYNNLNVLREEKLDEIAPALIPVGIAAARFAAPVIARLAARYAPTIGRGIVSGGKQAFSKGREYGKKAYEAYKKYKAKREKLKAEKEAAKKDRGLSKAEKEAARRAKLEKNRQSGPKDRKQSKISRVVRRGAALGAAALGGLAAGASDVDARLPKGELKAFSLKPKTGSSQEYRADSGASQRMRDARLSRQSQSAMMNIKEENNLDILKTMVDNNIVETTINFDQEKININNTMARKILHVYESVNSNNKKKIEKMLNEDTDSFNKILLFSIRQ